MAHRFEVLDAACLGSTPADEGRLRSFNLDQLVRERTAGKCYKPAAQWSLCVECAQPVSTRDSVVILKGLLRHAVCR